MDFVKGHGTGNDFVLLPDTADEHPLTAELVVGLADRRTGLGADGVIRVAPAPGGGWWMDHRNADGGPADMCGNGLRVFARYLVGAGLAAPGKLSILTNSGRRTVTVPVNPRAHISVDMGVARTDGIPRNVTVAGQAPAPGVSVDMGNPHVVTFVAGGLEDLNLSVAPLATPTFPDGVNVEIVTVTGPRSISMRVHERGVGETQSCGTGACAAAVASALAAGVTGDWEWDVRVPGGDLRIACLDGRIVMTGPAVLLASGQVDVEALEMNVVMSR